MKTTQTPDMLTRTSSADVASFAGRPGLSLKQPTHRRHPDKQQGPIRLRHLVKARVANPHEARRFESDRNALYAVTLAALPEHHPSAVSRGQPQPVPDGRTPKPDALRQRARKVVGRTATRMPCPTGAAANFRH